MKMLGIRMQADTLKWLQCQATELGIGPLDSEKSLAEQYSEMLLRIGTLVENGTTEQKQRALRVFWAVFLYLCDHKAKTESVLH